tara:strand:+ start:274 stop:897 length:624 start_codon:yes stop_codon:yes gene_type:complete
MLKPYYNENKLEVGIDEAGRGPLFGRVYVGCAILSPEDDGFVDINDSKKLTERKRLIAYDYIKENAIDYSVYYADEKVIDDINIFQATYNGMHEALNKLIVKPDHILVDGCYFYDYYDSENNKIPHTCIEKGDSLYSSIAAASILAKVERDNYIYDLCKNNPELDEHYGIKSNKGYGAKRHLDGIKTHGITKWHRKTFGICKKFASD